MPRDASLLIEAVVGVGLVAAGTISTLISFSKQLRNRQLKTARYGDEDGQSTAEALSAFSNRRAKVFILFFATAGFGCQMATAVLNTLNLAREEWLWEHWLTGAAWTLLVVQSFAVFGCRSSVQAYDLGLSLALSSLTLIVVLVLQNMVMLALLFKDHTLHIALRIATLGAAVGLTAASISLPRRPDVYFRKQVVDRMMTVNAYQRFTFGWCANVLAIAKQKKEALEATDLPRLNRSTRAADKAASWRKMESEQRLWLSLLWAYKWPLLIQWALSLAGSILGYLPQWFTLQILNTLERRPPNGRVDSRVWLFVVWLGLATLTAAITEANMLWVGYGQLSNPIRSQLSAVIFEKSMRRKNVKSAVKSDKPKDGEAIDPAAETIGAGDSARKVEYSEDNENDNDTAKQKSRQAVINLIGIDTRRIGDFATNQVFLIGAVGGLVIGVWFLATLLGWTALAAGFLIWFVTLLINSHFSKKYGLANVRLMKLRDQKLAIVNEALQGIRQIKLSALEPRWEQRILAAREKELKACWSVFIAETVLTACWFTSPIALAAVALSVYAWRNGQLTPSVAFVSVSVFRSLEIAVGNMPTLVTDAIDCWVSIKRVQEYLDGPERIKATIDNPEISFERASIAWPVDEEVDERERFILRDLNFVFPKGELSVISGQTGTGKSLLLAAILGEVDILSGSIYVPDPPKVEERFDCKANRDNWILPSSIAFVSQIPWLENASIQDNILFGLPLDEDRYEATIEACALRTDLKTLADSDRTELGANGINISGGQKWRVSLARAVYSRAGILVLDDIFSAVDAHVGRFLLEKCLVGDLCKGRTRILVTHHVALVAAEAKFVVELAKGGVAAAGLTSKLEEEGVIDKIKSHERPQQEEIAEDGAATAFESAAASGAAQGGREEGDSAPAKTLSRRPQKYIEDETRERGAIKTEVYATYLRESGGWIRWAFSAVIFLTYQFLVLGRSWWLKIWTGTHEESTARSKQLAFAYAYAPRLQPTLPTNAECESVHAAPEHSLGFYLAIYVALALLSAFLATFRYFYMFKLSIQASRSLFEKMAFVILRTPLRWVDTVPVGRILNRFTADFSTFDTRLARSLGLAVSSALSILGICVAAMFVSPYIILLAAALLAVCIFLADQYLDSARPVKRLESTTKSPIFELFGTALAGVSTIRSFDKTETYIQRMYDRLDDYNLAVMYLFLFSRWILWRMSLLGFLYSTIVTAVVLLKPGMSASLAGFAMSFSLDLSSSVLYLIRILSHVELSMNAAERIMEYTELKTEDLGGRAPPAAWPTRGELQVENLVVRYAPDLPAILKGVSFSIRPHERVGIVGRTGAGKSSLTLALFRFLEPSSGSICIDGLDISEIRLRDLRSRLAIIPQDPILFSGTVRSNIDPFDDHTDAEIHDCLRRVHLVSELDSDTPTPTKTSASTVPMPSNAVTPKNISIFEDLGSPISEGGQNLSQGQRQLLCLARAIIARPKIIVLDEATSAVDMQTDALIQQSIRDEFRDATLLVIAHRLSTVADFDRVLVLSEGEVAEFGSPRELWQKKDGVFRGLCEESGERDRLRAIILEC